MIKEIHNFIKTKTWGYKIVVLFSLAYTIFLGTVVFMTSKYSIEYKSIYCVGLFFLFTIGQFSLFICHMMYLKYKKSF